MDGEVPDFTHTLEGFDRLVLMLHWADRCTIAEMERILGTERHCILDSMNRIRNRAIDALPVSLSTLPAVSRDHRHPPLRRR